ncbi:MAG: M28 family peptidase [Acidobacteriota bacterium]|nr:M28 family peptidase [Acidobacteriota bacterium]
MTYQRPLGLVIGALAFVATGLALSQTARLPGPIGDVLHANIAADRDTTALFYTEVRGWQRWPVFQPATMPLPNLVADAVRLDQPTGEERFTALVTLLQDQDLVPEIRPFRSALSDGSSIAGRNVEVAIGDGVRDIVVGAHADAVTLEDGTLVHAMVDNAAAVAVLARVAKTLPPHELHHRIRVVFFDLEERGLLGSRHFVDSNNPDRVAGMINLDIAGYGDTVLYGPSAAPGNEAVYRAVRLACGQGEHQCLEFAQFPTSDDRSFQTASIPNVSLGILPRQQAHQLWLILNGDEQRGIRDDFVPPILQTIHTPNDHADQLDAEGMTLAYNTVMNIVLQLDQQLAR